MTATKDQVFIQDLLSRAGVTVGGTKPQDIQVRNSGFYTRVLREGPLGLGESYMDAWWDCEAIDQFIDRVLRAHVDQEVKRSVGLLWYAARARIFNPSNGRLGHSRLGGTTTTSTTTCTERCSTSG